MDKLEFISPTCRVYRVEPQKVINDSGKQNVIQDMSLEDELLFE